MPDFGHRLERIEIRLMTKLTDKESAGCNVKLRREIWSALRAAERRDDCLHLCASRKQFISNDVCKPYTPHNRHHHDALCDAETPKRWQHQECPHAISNRHPEC